MVQIDSFLSLIDSYIGGAQWFVLFLIGTGLFFTIYLKFPQIRFFKHALQVVSGKYDKSHHVGDATHFQALCTALSGTVGTGNIAGVALAIHLGGPSALFWMLMTAFVGMTTKMVEVTLSHKYRDQMPDGSISGGPMYYMKNKLHAPWLAAIFAVCTILSAFGTGNLPQSNSISNAMFSAFGIPHYIVGAVLAFLIALIILGGIKRIAKVAEKLVPFMAIIYLLGAFSVLIYNYDQIIPAFLSMFTNLFTGTAATGGFLGATVAWAFNRGVNRGLFSNEAGQGSAPIAHAAAKAEEPASEGMVALLEPFIDTICICLLTGLVILSSGAWQEKVENQFQQADILVLSGTYDADNAADVATVSEHVLGKAALPLFTGELNAQNGQLLNSDITMLHARSFAEDVRVKTGNGNYTGPISVRNGRVSMSTIDQGSVSFTGKSLIHSAPLSSEAFKKGFLGDWGAFIIPISLLLFAFSTALAWAYYGDRAVVYLWGKKYVKVFQIIYVIMFFVASFTDTTIVWAFSGVTVAFMTLPNLIGILLLHKDVKTTINAYWKKIQERG